MGISLAAVQHHVENAIRWHFYDLAKWGHSYDPGCGGMDSDVLSGLIESLLDPSTYRRLRAEGKAWATLESECMRTSLTNGELTWPEASERLRGSTGE